MRDTFVRTLVQLAKADKKIELITGAITTTSGKDLIIAISSVA